MAKLTFDQALELIAEERSIAREQVQARALRRKVWFTTYSAPGCLPDGRNISLTKKDAIDSAWNLYGDDAPRGFKGQLRRHGIAAADAQGFYRVEIQRLALADLF